MLVAGKAVRHRWAECFDELLNVEGGLQASVMAVRGNRKMLESGRKNDRGGRAMRWRRK